MAIVTFEQGADKDEVIIRVKNIGEKGKPSSTGKSEVRGFGTAKFMASDGSQVVLGLNAYVRQ
jgi:hypothetical protein